MTSARRLYRLVATLAAVGLLAAAAGLVVAAAKTSLAPPEARVLASACRQLLPSGASLLALPVLALAALGLVVLARAVRSACKHARAELRLRRSLLLCSRHEVGGATLAVVDDPTPRAFCAGYLRPRICLSSGALAGLSEAQLEAVLAHERYHVRRRDPLRLLVAHVLADGLFFLPALRRVAERYGALAELAADEAAARATSASTLASALLAFSGDPSSDLVVGIAPERVDHLLGERARWELSAPVLAASLLALAGLTATILAVLWLAGARVNVALSLAQSCMALMYATALGTAGTGLLLAKRRGVRRRTV